jgi:hypothetical protein
MLKKLTKLRKGRKDKMMIMNKTQPKTKMLFRALNKKFNSCLIPKMAFKTFLFGLKDFLTRKKWTL